MLLGLKKSYKLFFLSDTEWGKDMVSEGARIQLMLGSNWCKMNRICNKISNTSIYGKAMGKCPY